MLNQAGAPVRPDWISDELYPFVSRWYSTADGHRMHFVDEGEGAPIVFAHGNPSWSIEFRHLISGLRDHFRCIAIDHVGLVYQRIARVQQIIIRRLTLGVSLNSSIISTSQARLCS